MAYETVAPQEQIFIIFPGGGDVIESNVVLLKVTVSRSLGKPPSEGSPVEQAEESFGRRAVSKARLRFISSPQ